MERKMAWEIFDLQLLLVDEKDKLEERLIQFAAVIIEIAEGLPSSFAGNHLAINLSGPALPLRSIMARPEERNPEVILYTK
jgi:hypothetical protein